MRVLNFGVCTSSRLLALGHSCDAMGREIFDCGDVVLLEILFNLLLVDMLQVKQYLI